MSGSATELPPSAARGEGDLGWTEFFAVLSRRRWLVATTTALGAVLALAFSFLQAPIWLADARVQVEAPKSSPSALAALGANLPAGISSLVGGALPIASEVERIRSRGLTRRVLDLPPLDAEADALGIVRVFPIEQASVWHAYFSVAAAEETPELELLDWTPSDDFDDPLEITAREDGSLRVGFRRLLDARAVDVRPAADGSFEFSGARLRWTSPPSAGRTYVVTLRQPRDAVDEFLESLAVSETDRGSSVLRIGFAAPTAALAADICNGVVRAYVEDSRARRVEQLTASVDYLSGELERVGDELAAAEASMVEYLRTTGPSALPETAEQLVEQLAEVGLEQARARYAGERLRERLTAIDADELDELELAALEYSLGLTEGEAPGLSTMFARRDALRQRYTSEWPELRELEAEIAGRVGALRAAVEQLLAEQTREASDLDSMGRELEASMAALPDSQLGFARRKRDVQTAQEISIFLHAQLEDARISLAGVSPSVDVIDWAIEPERRLRPRLKVNLLLGLLAGSVVGLLFAFVREARRPVFTSDRLQDLAGCPVFGEVARGSAALPMRDELDGPIADQYRALRAAFQSSSSARTWTVTSARRDEGGATTAANLAVALARGGERVLLVDATPTGDELAGWFGSEEGQGLPAVLAGSAWNEVVTGTDVPGLELLSGGERGGSLADGVASGALGPFLEQAAATYDRVLFAAPGLEDSSDALALVSATEAVLFVLRASGHSAVVSSALGRLRRVGRRPSGAVLFGASR